VVSQGDGNIRYYELTPNERPYLHYLTEFQSKSPQRGLGVMPKRAVNVRDCEIYRFYKVHSTLALIEPLSFIVPRKVGI
jgi:coronin-2